MNRIPRKTALALLMKAGYDGDMAESTRVYIEGRISMASARLEYAKGQRWRINEEERKRDGRS